MNLQTMQSTTTPLQPSSVTNTASPVIVGTNFSNAGLSLRSPSPHLDNAIKVVDSKIELTNCSISINNSDAIEALMKISRLNSILLHKPSEKMLSKYQALKEAYEQYCVIEALVLSGEDNND